VRQEAAEVRLDLRIDARAAQKVLNQNRHLHEVQLSLHVRERESLNCIGAATDLHTQIAAVHV
jgi:hypothetical protein